MNTTKFNKYFKKIKSFGELVENLESLSIIEKDLLKDYIKKMYESVIESEDNPKPVKNRKKQKKSPVEVKQKTEIQIEDKIDDNSANDEVKFEESTHEVKVEKKMTKTQTEPENIVLENKDENIPSFSNDLLDLFEIGSSNELSQKLSLIPIKNLKRSFSINERIFTVKELFGGDKTVFENTLEAIDNLSNLEEAKEYLLKNVVSKFGWDDPALLKKVKGFVSNVKRRFL